MDIIIEDDIFDVEKIAVEPAPLPALKEDQLLQMVLQGGNIEVLEKFLDLREREESRSAAKEFDLHFAAMQAEFGAVGKNKKGYDYNYAPLEDLQKFFGPVISKHGFSYRWTEARAPEGKTVTIIISGWGSSRENSFDVPFIKDPKYTKQMNDIQVMGTMSSYGQRYTFKAGFGLIIGGDDTDGILPGTGEEYAQAVLQIDSCGSMKELMATWSSLYPGIKNDKSALTYLGSVFSSKKDALGGK